MVVKRITRTTTEVSVEEVQVLARIMDAGEPGGTPEEPVVMLILNKAETITGKVVVRT